MKQNKSMSMYLQANKNKKEANKAALMKVPPYVNSVHSGQQAVSPTIYQLFPILE